MATLVPPSPNRTTAGRAARTADLKRRLLAVAAEYDERGKADQAEFWRDLAGEHGHV